jgi:predicted metalloendopeptidase
MAEKLFGGHPQQMAAQPQPTTEDMVSVNNTLKERLEILYDYEKKYLDLTKNYKEEIKFAATLQEDIRKERAKFFADTLKDVQKTLDDLKVDQKVVEAWITELVGSYTKSLDISADLSKDHILDMLGILKDASKKDLANIAPN